MTSFLDELRTLAADLEAEGHAAAGRLRDLIEHIRDDFGLIGNSGPSWWTRSRRPKRGRRIRFPSLGWVCLLLT